MRRLGVVDGLDGLRHDAVVGGDHQDRHVGQLGAAGTHGGERLVAGGVEERDLALLALQRHGDLVGADALGDAAGLARDDVGAADGVEQSGLAVIDMAHDGDHRRTRLQILVLLQLLLVQVDVELLQQLLVLLLGGHDLDVPADLLAEDLERRLVQGLRGRGHLAEMEQHGDQRGRVDVDLLGQVGQRGALTQTDGLAVAGGDAHAADGRGLQLLELLAFREPVLTRLRGLAALTAECAGRATATAAAAACGTVVRGTALMATGRIAAETVAADRTVAGTALTGTMLAPLPGLGLRALARTATEASTAAALTRTAIAAAATAVLDGRASHRMRTRDVARRGGMHPLLAAERIVAGTGTALAGAVLRLLAVALRGGTTVVLLAGLLMPALALAGLRGRAMMPRLAGLLGGGSGLRAGRGRLRGRMQLLRMGGGGRGLGRRHRLGGRGRGRGLGRGRLRGRGLMFLGAGVLLGRTAILGERRLQATDDRRFHGR